MAKQPGDRPASMEVVINELDDILASQKSKTVVPDAK